jgi:hypothetical protein
MRHGYENRLRADQLAALAAVVEFGGFDAAAERLHVTPSAVSQRIKALEQRVGQVLVIREKPCKDYRCRDSASPLGGSDRNVGVRGARRDGGRLGGVDTDCDCSERRFDVDLVHHSARQIDW